MQTITIVFSYAVMNDSFMEKKGKKRKQRKKKGGGEGHVSS